jgi:hypothetical protein
LLEGFLELEAVVLLILLIMDILSLLAFKGVCIFAFNGEDDYNNY